MEVLSPKLLELIKIPAVKMALAQLLAQNEPCERPVQLPSGQVVILKRQ